MKLNKTLLIMALVAGGVFAAEVAVYAQDSSNTPPPTARPPAARGPRSAMNFDYVATELALTDDQKTKAKPVFDEMRQKMMDLRKDTTLEPTDRRAKMKEIRDDTTAKLKDIFTPEQFEKWQKMAPGNRRPPGGAGAPPAAAPKPPQ